jgi:hypothetical protein
MLVPNRPPGSSVDTRAEHQAPDDRAAVDETQGVCYGFLQ